MTNSIRRPRRWPLGATLAMIANAGFAADATKGLEVEIAPFAVTR